MSTKSLHKRINLKELLSSFQRGMPVTSRQLEDRGISRQLAHRYVQSGWLKSLGYGYYLRLGDSLTQTGAVAALQNQGVPVHIGGRTALALRGFVHYLPLGHEKLFLYGAPRKILPAWFLQQFTPEVRTGNLFHEGKGLEDRLYVSALETDEPSPPLTADPERALLEMLDDVPQKQSLDDARKIMEPFFTLRSEVMQTLLEACTRIKVKRLFHSLAEQLRLPVLDDLKLERIDFGAPSAYVLPRQGESLVLKHPESKSDG
jgi:hypothetical protein